MISPNVSNKNLNTILVAPLTSSIRNFPMRMKIIVEKKTGQIAFDQIRCIDKKRISGKMVSLTIEQQVQVKNVLKEYLID